MTTISIIMPVYNGAKFLQRSFDSILKQTLSDIEVIFINDGSTDNSLEILEGFKREHDFIKILNQNNLGSGKARNYGIEEAKGEYLAFLDADDFFIDNDALEKMYNKGHSNNADMVTANIKHDLKEKGKFEPFGPFYYYRNDEVIHPEKYGIPWSFYKNIFKKDFLTENKIKFPDLLRGQDPVFLAEVLTKVDEIYAVATDIYAYVYNSDAAKASNYRKLYDQLLHYKMVFDYFNNPIFKKRQNEYFYKIFLFMGRLDESDSLYALKAVREIFTDYPDFLRRLENWLYLKFKNNEEFMDNFRKYPKVSIITPVHNDEHYLDSFIRSITTQELNDIEIIFVDTNSTDKTNRILTESKKEDSRIKLLSIDNKDYAQALNTGLENATGDYVYFAYVRDYLFKDALKKLFENAVLNGSDVTLFNIANYKDHKHLNFTSGYDFKEKLGNINHNYFTSDYHFINDLVMNFEDGTYYKLYRKNFLLENDMKFITNSINYNLPVHMETLIKAKRLSYVPQYLCYHKVLNIELPHYNRIEYLFTKNEFNMMGLFNVMDKIESILEENNLFEKYEKPFIKFKLSKILLYLDYSHFNIKDTDNLMTRTDSLSDEFFIKSKEIIGECSLEYATPYFYKKANLLLKSKDYIEYNELSQEFDSNELELYNKQLTYDNNKLEQHNKQLMQNKNNKIKKLNKENNNLSKKRKELNKKINKVKSENEAMLSSNSWKMTKFLRKS